LNYDNLKGYIKQLAWNTYLKILTTSLSVKEKEV
jgi:hypothetical protein